MTESGWYIGIFSGENGCALQDSIFVSENISLPDFSISGDTTVLGLPFFHIDVTLEDSLVFITFADQCMTIISWMGVTSSCS